MKLSRRAFIEGAASLAAAGLLGSQVLADGEAPAAEGPGSAEGPGGEGDPGSAEGSGGGGPMMQSAGIEDPNWREAPNPDDFEIAGEYDCDVLVLGCGYAGSACMRKAAVMGKKVIGVDQQFEEFYNVFGGDVGIINSQVQKGFGIPEVDPVEYMNNWQMCCANRAEPDLLKYFAYHSGEAFDFYVEPIGEEGRAKLQPLTWEGIPEEWNSQLGAFHTYPGAISIKIYGSSQVPLDNIHDACDNYGAQMLWGHVAEVLLKDEEGRVTGAIVCNQDDDCYYKINASVGVVVGCGDFSANTTMFKELIPEIMESNPNTESPSGNGRTGMGQKLCYWAGGAFEIGPRAGMGGVSGNPMGVWQGTHILLLDKDGYRFCNEAFAHNFVAGIPAQRRESGLCSVWGSNFRDTVARMPVGHLNLGDFTQLEKDAAIFNADAEDSGPDGFTYGRTTVYCAHDLATLASYCGYEGEAAEQFVASVERYNELAAAGVDADYGKPSEVLFPIEPPYFAAYSGMGGGAGVLVTLAGMFTDRNCQVRAQKTFKPIPGLFAIGNCCGGRFPLQYTSPINGVSIAWAITSGYQAGEYLGSL
ncbi:MAG: FAD-binding protein [Lachnospiraceae bacterium]|nr:FAD-binding protein [Lachnospiraceae bacterium]